MRRSGGCLWGWCWGPGKNVPAVSFRVMGQRTTSTALESFCGERGIEKPRGGLRGEELISQPCSPSHPWAPPPLGTWLGALLPALLGTAFSLAQTQAG